MHVRNITTVYTVYTVFIFHTLCSYSTAVDCGSLTVLNGQVNTTSGNIFESKATYACDDGYTLNGTSIRICQANGTWSLKVPTCDCECFEPIYS